MATKEKETKADKAADKKKGIKQGSPEDLAIDKKGGFVPFAKKGKRKAGPTGEYKGKNPAGEKK